MKSLSLLAVLALMVVLGEERAAGALTVTAFAGACTDHSLPDARCTSVFVDPVTGSEIRTESVVHGEYGYLYARTTSEVRNWSIPAPPLGGGAWAYFDDVVTVAGSNRIGLIEAHWDYGRSGFAEDPALYVTIANDLEGGPLFLSASIHVGEDPYGIFLDGEAWVRLASTRLRCRLQSIDHRSVLHFEFGSGVQR